MCSWDSAWSSSSRRRGSCKIARILCREWSRWCWSRSWRVRFFSGRGPWPSTWRTSGSRIGRGVATVSASAPWPGSWSSTIVTRLTITVASHPLVSIAASASASTPASTSTRTSTSTATSGISGIIRVSLFHLLTEPPGPSIVCFTIDDFARDLISNDRLAQLVDVDYPIIPFPDFLRSIYSVHIFQKGLECRHQFLISGSCQKLQRFDRLRTKRDSRIWDNVRNKVACWEVVIGCGRIAMRRRHNKRCISAIDFLCRVLITLLYASRCLYGARRGWVPDHLPQLLDIVRTVVPMITPDIQEVIQPPMMLGILLPIVRCRITQQFHNIWLQRATESRKADRRVRMILGVMKQIIQQVKNVQSFPLRRRVATTIITGLFRRFPTSILVIRGAKRRGQCDQVFPQNAHPVRWQDNIFQKPWFASLY